VVMCCTFGDKTDVEWWKSHKLPLKVSLNKNGTMNELAGKYATLKIKDARKQIIEDLKDQKLLINQKEITHPVNTHERCATELEILKTKQWFVRILDKKEELLDAGNKITWYPEHMKVRYTHWVENLNWDWCISRQRHFGVPFPVWYEPGTGKIVVASYDQLPCDPLRDKPKQYKGDASTLIPEVDVMDTWATSSVTPQIITNWKDKGKYALTQKQFPTSMRPQGHDIIRTWAFYTIVKAHYNNNTIPWKELIVTGHVLDPHGNKMSKSKGNVVDPRIILDKFGADAMRFWTASSKLGDDLPFQEKDLQTGKKTVTKLWNASNFALMNLSDFDYKKPELEVMDKWMLSKVNKTILAASDGFEKNEYLRCKMETDKLFWQHFCDNYLEICKDRVYNPDRRGLAGKRSAQYALYHTLLAINKLFAPIMPHITEAIYQSHFKSQEKTLSIHKADWPKSEQFEYDAASEIAGDVAVAIITAVRKFKSTQQASLKAEIQTLSIHCSKPLQQAIMSVMEDLKATTHAQNIHFGDGTIETGYEDVRISATLAPETK